MASLRNVDVGVVSGIDLKRGVLKILTLKLVSSRDVVGASRLHIDTRVQRVNSRVEIGSFTVEAGLVVGEVTTFSLVDYATGSDETVLYNFNTLDSLIQPGQFTVTVVPVPEPTGLLALGGLAGLALLRRR